MINPIEVFDLQEEVLDSKMDLDLYFKFALLLQIEKLNHSLSEIDFELKGLVGK